MPVVVQCFHCNAVLELDDGFRGGVCRCATCGSLLQVPKGEADAPPKAKRVRPAVPPGPAAPPSRSEDSTGLSSGALDPRRSDPGLSSGLIHKTRPIAMPARPARKSPAPATPDPVSPPAQPAGETRPVRQGGNLVLAIVIILLIAAILAGAVWAFVKQTA